MRIRVQNGSDFEMWTMTASESASVGSLSQLGPSSPVSLKITLLMMPHSGLSMNRNDRMVGIDGTAQGRMNNSESQRVDDRAGKDRVVEQPHIGLRIAREPEAVGDRVEHEHQEDEKIRGDQDEAPDLPRRHRRRGPGRPRAIGFLERERRHRNTLSSSSWPGLSRPSTFIHPRSWMPGTRACPGLDPGPGMTTRKLPFTAPPS